MKNRVILIVLMLMVIVKGFSQSPNTSLYSLAVKAFVKQIKVQAGGINIINDSYLALPPSIGSLRINRLADSTLELNVKDSITIAALRIQPIEVQGEYLIVNVLEYLISSEKSELNFKYTGGLKVYFHFNCTTKKFGLVRTKKVSF